MIDRVWFSKGLRGLSATRIQQYLVAQGFTVGPSEGFVDGDFGAMTETAIGDLQIALGRPRLGAVDTDTWNSLTPDPLPSLFNRCLDLTAAFEGHGFTLLQGNFDGAGFTWGIVGFTLQSGELTTLLHDIDALAAGTVDAALGPLAHEWNQATAQSWPEQLAWADSLSQPGSKQFARSDWKQAFERLGRTPAAQQAQCARARQDYFVRALAQAQRLNLVTELGVALAFDVCVQNGGFKAAAFELAEQLGDTVTEAELRLRLADTVAESAKPEWIENVRARKRTIAAAAGEANKTPYRLSSWGLEDVLAE